MQKETRGEKLFKLFTLHREKIMYLFFGFITTIVNMATFFFLVYGCHISLLWANLWAWIVAVSVAFITNHKFVFVSHPRDGPIIKAFISFVSSRLFSFFLELGLLWLLVTYLGYANYIIKPLIAILVVIINYLTSRFFVFQKKE